MKEAAAVFLGFLTVHVGLLHKGEAADSTCNYFQLLKANTSYYIYNPGYPMAYRGAHNCQWTARSDFRVALVCDIDIPWSRNCSTDYIEMNIDEFTTRRYCGKDSFVVESRSNTITVKSVSAFWSSGGKYLCDMRSLEKTQESEDCRCGWKKPTRIVGGMETGINEYPMMAGVVDFEIRTLICGATIISEQYVLTAAHCLTNRLPQQLGILVGDHDLSTGRETNATELFKVKKFEIHPDYKGMVSGNDIAVVMIDGRLQFSNEVGPACLPFQHDRDSFAGSYVDVLGWGSTDFGGDRSNTLQVANVPVVTNLECRRDYSRVTRDQLCTRATNKDACQFDSGGPVLWQNPVTRKLVGVGIISYGIGCAAASSSVNTRIGAYMNWIVTQTPGAFYCMTE